MVWEWEYAVGFDHPFKTLKYIYTTRERAIQGFEEWHGRQPYYGINGIVDELFEERETVET